MCVFVVFACVCLFLLVYGCFGVFLVILVIFCCFWLFLGVFGCFSGVLGCFLVSIDDFLVV